MWPDILLAKSPRTRDGGHGGQTLLQHTREVLECATRLVQYDGQVSCTALGLDPLELVLRLPPVSASRRCSTTWARRMITSRA